MEDQFKDKSLRAPALQGYAWTVLEFTADKVFSLIVFTLLGRLLGPSQFGSVAIAASLTLLVQPLFSNGLRQALILQKQISQADVDSAFWANLLMSVVLVGLMFALAPLIARAYDQPDLATLLRMMSVTWIFAALAAIPSALLARRFKFRTLALRPFFAGLVSLVTSVVMAFNHFGAMSLVAFYISRVVTAAAIAFVGSGYRPRLRLSLSSLKGMARVCADSVAVTVLTNSTSLIMIVVVGYLFDPAVAGLFRMAQMLVETVNSALFHPLGRVSVAVFGNVSEDPARVRAIYMKTTILANVVAIPVVGGLIVVSPDFATIVLGPQWEVTGRLAQILALTLTTEALISVVRAAMFSIGQSRAALYRTAIDAISVPIAILIASPFGILAVAWALALRALLFSAYPLYLVRRHFSIEPISVLRQAMPSIIATVIMVAVCFGVRAPLLTIMPIYGVLAVEVVLGVLVYLTVVRLLRPPVLGEATDVVHPKIKPRLQRIPVVRWLFVGGPGRSG